MKKVVILLLAISLLAVSLVGCSNNEQPDINNEVTNDTTVEQDNLTEPAPASDFEYEINSIQTGIFINKYIGSSENVIIPSHIEDLPVIALRGVPHKQYPTAVETGVFEGKNVCSVVIPKTITYIGFRCFKDCQNLKSVEIASDSSLTLIIGSAFENCVELEEIDISSTQIKEIGSLAFHNCAKLKNVAFSSTLESIQEKAFYECSSLLEVDLPESLTVIKRGAFASCTCLKKIEVPTKLDLIFMDGSIFYEVPNMKTIVFREGRASITGYALLQTKSSVEIVVPKGVKRFSPGTFLIDPNAEVRIIFLGDAPEIVDDNTSYFGNPKIYYDPNTNGWDHFAWNEKFEVKPIQ